MTETTTTESAAGEPDRTTFETRAVWQERSLPHLGTALGLAGVATYFAAWFSAGAAAAPTTALGVAYIAAVAAPIVASIVVPLTAGRRAARAARVSVDEARGEMVVDRVDARPLRIACTAIHEGWLTHQHGGLHVVLRLSATKTLVVAVGSLEEGRALLRACGVAVEQRVVRMPLVSRLGGSALGPWLAAATLGACAAPWILAGAGSLAATLGRGGRPIGQWAAALREALTVEGDYRRAPLSVATAMSVLRDGAAPLEQRVGAAVALGASASEPTRVELRAAVATCADPRVRVVLERAADGALEDAEVQAALQHSSASRRA